MEHKKQQLSRVNNTWNTKIINKQELTIHGTQKATTIKSQQYMEHKNHQQARVNHTWNTKKQQLAKVNHTWNTKSNNSSKSQPYMEHKKQKP